MSGNSTDSKLVLVLIVVAVTYMQFKSVVLLNGLPDGAAPGMPQCGSSARESAPERCGDGLIYSPGDELDSSSEALSMCEM